MAKSNQQPQSLRGPTDWDKRLKQRERAEEERLGRRLTGEEWGKLLDQVG
jgi:hypothetical protein